MACQKYYYGIVIIAFFASNTFSKYVIYDIIYYIFEPTNAM